MSSILERAFGWLDGDPDPEHRAELSALIERAKSDPEAERELTDRFSGPLEFGTAGLRGVVAAGESRFNLAVVLRATHGFGRYLLEIVPGAAERGVVIGHDARPKSEACAVAAAECAAALGLRVHLLRGPSPTPLVAFAVKQLGAAGGAVVTASHNPPEYNGFKVYLDRGAQIVPPHDAEIARRIAEAPRANAIPRAPGSDLIRDARAIERDYIEAILGLRGVDVPAERLKIAYTPLHGVGARLTKEVFAAAGYRDFHLVAEQAEPDGRFPTVRFPNPEEPGALDRLIALATQIGADLALAQDPDADRMAAAVRDHDGRFVVLSGNELGVLLGHHVLTRERTSDPARLVITTVVSSAQLKRIAAELGVGYAESLTGFKWIAATAMDAEAQGARFVFGYEEALGYTIGTVTRDKDGVGAALVMAELAADAKAQGETVLDRLRAIRERFGLYVSRQKSLTMPGREGAEKIRSIMHRLRSAPPPRFGAIAAESCWDLEARTRLHFGTGARAKVDSLPPADVLIFDLEGGGRLAVRPSGTEPKIKLYFEVVETLGKGEPIDLATARGQARIDELLAAVVAAAEI